uniref:Chemokine interleukin-8-like domain-containing protein n=1 Tax=Cyprinodon variegatus TaxID=28743 RepID=A0A3Q2EI12_CYPVA
MRFGVAVRFLVFFLLKLRVNDYATSHKASDKSIYHVKHEKQKFSLTCQCFFFSLYKGFQGPCCTKNFNNPIRLQNLKAYWMQFDTGNCNINSTIFLTVKNKLVCANPDMPWVRRAIEYLK